MGRKRLLPGVLPSKRRLDLFYRREGGGHGGKPPIPIPMVKVSSLNAAAYSEDNGTTWILTTIPAGSWIGVTWIGNKYVAIGSPGPGVATAATSVDGINWVSQTIQQEFFTGLGSNGVITVASGTSGALSTTTDGITWTARTPSPADNLRRKIKWSPELGLFVGIGTGGAYSSPDGLTWTLRSNLFIDRALAWSPALGLFAGFRGGTQTMYTSANGTAWVSHAFADASFASWGSAAWNGMAFAALPDSNPARSAASTDGINWTFGTSIASGANTSLTTSGTRFVGVGGNKVVTSDDNGVTWTSRVPASNAAWAAVASPTTGS